MISPNIHDQPKITIVKVLFIRFINFQIFISLINFIINKLLYEKYVVIH